MTCPTCKSKKQFHDFCGNCGAYLKEKCPICGEMEAINRPICEKLVSEAEKQLELYIKGVAGEWRMKLSGIIFLLFWPAFFATVNLSAYCIKSLPKYLETFAPIFLIVVIVICPLLIFKFLMRLWSSHISARKKAEAEFLSKNPAYAEAIKKEEQWWESQRYL